MRKVPIYFDHGIDLVDVMRAVASINCTLRGDARGRLVVQPKQRRTDFEDSNVIPFDRLHGEAPPCD